MQSRAILRLGQLRRADIVAVGFIYNYTIGHFHDTTFYTLQFIACPGNLDKEEEIYHRMHSGFALPYTNSFHKNVVVAGSLTKHDSFSCFPCHTTQTTGRRGRANKSVGMHGKLLHAGLVAQNRAFGPLA